MLCLLSWKVAVGARLQDTKGNRYFFCGSAQNAESTKVQYVPATEANCYSLLVSDGLVAAVTHAHLELEAHEGDGGALGRTFAAHCLAALPAVVLRNTGGHEHDSFISNSLFSY